MAYCVRATAAKLVLLPAIRHNGRQLAADAVDCLYLRGRGRWRRCVRPLLNGLLGLLSIGSLALGLGLRGQTRLPAHLVGGDVCVQLQEISNLPFDVLQSRLFRRRGSSSVDGLRESRRTRRRDRYGHGVLQSTHRPIISRFEHKGLRSESFLVGWS